MRARARARVRVRVRVGVGIRVGVRVRVRRVVPEHVQALGRLGPAYVECAAARHLHVLALGEG